MADTKQFSFIVPDELHKKARRLALEHNRPLSEILRQLVEEWIEDEERKAQAKQGNK